ncbi:PD-(D/E)XK motif protein [Kineosporia sp. NBRC 101731]|uniref:PD-(D/E)XK motif protein n=1 Tax=Kineosporia sp. NBRC 101731 TaxID=3032199 RepID=UPI0024A38E6A|nr:PD-(D/E)XK motif protein [Kineosporia sp. NBRC 101731]GLY31597.1 hypothetical protein Kisp02_49620 [Kineosporia sp. NBRC 101731]
MSALERAWAVLSPPSNSQYASFSLDLQLGESTVRVAVDREGVRHLLVPAAGEGLVSDNRPSVLQLRVQDLQFGGDFHTYVDLSCADAELHKEFDEVVKDVLDAVEEAEHPGAETLRTVARWRRLFRSRLVRGLSLQAKIGLFAELSVLSALLDRAPSLSIDCWTGPLRKPHDFEMPVRCLEVKGLGLERDGFTVHGLEQLDTHEDRPLDLVVVTVVPDPEGTSLEELIQQLRERVSGRGEFRRRLVASGWSEDQVQPAADFFSISSVVHVEVTDAVPRLVARDLLEGRLPNGLSELSYRVDLGELMAHASGISLPQLVERVLP